MPSHRPRGRPLSFDREAALDRVIPIFWRKGFASPSLDELAAAAELNRPNLAAAFGDKRGLYLAALKRFRSNFFEHLSLTLNGPGSLLECFDAFFDGATTIYADEGLGCFVFGTTPAASGDDSHIRDELRKTLDMVREAFGRRIQASGLDNIGVEKNDSGYADALLSILVMLALSARAGMSRAELQNMHKNAVRAILSPK